MIAFLLDDARFTLELLTVVFFAGGLWANVAALRGDVKRLTIALDHFGEKLVNTRLQVSKLESKVEDL